jgi:hypothetical protein
MSSPDEIDRTRLNPFATRYIRPGALAYRFANDISAATLVQTLRDHAWCGEIVGPHGVGKSTLLASLLPALSAAGRDVLAVSLHAGQHRLPPDLPSWRTWNQRTQLVIDGYEQLSFWSRTKLNYQRWLRGAGLLITTHVSFGMPTILELTPQVAVAVQVVRDLGVTVEQIDEATIHQAFAACHGNLRETLFRLYDVVERQWRGK